MTAKRLLIYLTTHPDTTASWVARDETGVIQHTVSEGNIADLSAYAHGYETTVIIPGQDVLLTKAILPKLNRQRLLQALPYALEEQLITDVQDLHFAMGEHQAEDGTVFVGIIKRQLLETYIETLLQVGITATLMIPATLALPLTPNQWQVSILKDICFARTGKYEGFACDHANIATFLSLQLATTTDIPESLQVYRFTHDSMKVELPSVTTHEINCLDKNALALMGDWLDKSATINLLQGSFSSKKTSSLIKKIWMASAGMAIAWVSLLFLSHIVSYIILGNALRSSELAIHTIYKKHFPAATSVVAPRARMQEKLKKFSGDDNKNDTLNLLGMIGNNLHQAPMLHVKQLDFRDHQLVLTITAPSFEDLDHFSQSLTHQGLTVKQQSAGITDAEIKANLIIHTGVA